jgi:hypothetical protein
MVVALMSGDPIGLISMLLMVLGATFVGTVLLARLINRWWHGNASQVPRTHREGCGAVCRTVGEARMMDVLWLVVGAVFVVLLALIVWRRGGAHSEEPPESR